MGMSISLADDKGTVKVPTHLEGGNVALVKDDEGDIVIRGTRFSGTQEAEMDVTSNYSKFFPFRALHGKLAADVVDEMEDASRILGTNQGKNHWERTPGNAGHTLSVLAKWARAHPHATFYIY